MGLACVPQNGNAGNFVVAKYIFTDLCVSHRHFLEHDTHYQSTSSYWPIFYTFPDQ